MSRLRLWLLWLGGGLLTLVVLLIVASFFVDEPLRRFTEQKLNANVKGYHFTIGKLDFHPIGFSLDLYNVTVVKESAPDPPVATLGRWHTSLHWKALLFGRLVNDHLIESPVLHLTRQQAKEEAEDEVPVEKKGWQEALEAVYPFKVDHFEVRNGDLTYVDEAQPQRPLRFHNIQVVATNIRNVRSGEREYPSELHFEADLFDSGHVSLDGHANFLAEPHPGAQVDFQLRPTPLDRLMPVTGRYNVQLREGTVAADGKVEYAPSKKLVELKTLTLAGVHADYVHAARTSTAEAARGKQAYETGKQVAKSPEIHVHVEDVELKDCELGFVNEAADPAYRIFLADTNLQLAHLSNQFADGTGTLTLTGKFMGTGSTEVNGTFRREGRSPDFDLAVKIQETQMKPMNNLWRAYANFDVVKGLFSFYSELRIKDGMIEGYLKPLFRDLQVYDEHQDRDKGFLRKMYEGLVEDLTSMLKNVPREEVATKTELSGQLEHPETSTWEAILRLIQNAFFEAILPGLERQVGSR
jgi:hypothetical protein